MLNVFEEAKKYANINTKQSNCRCNISHWTVAHHIVSYERRRVRKTN